MAYDTDNIFAKILRGEIPNKTVAEGDTWLAFEDIAPAAPNHVLVIPKGAYISQDDFHAKASDDEIVDFWRGVQSVAAKLGLSGPGYRSISNHAADANQEVPHFHVHVLGGKNLGALLTG